MSAKLSIPEVWPFFTLSVYAQVECYHRGDHSLGIDSYTSAILHKVRPV
jgi:hypothetical protein